MYNYGSGYRRSSHPYENSPDDYFRDADSSDAGQQQYYYRQSGLGMSQTGYSGASGSMQPSHAAPSQQQPIPPPHAGMSSYHQQPSGPPYVIGPGQYNSPAQLAYRQQQPSSYQQHQSPTQQQQQHPQQSARPAFLVQQQGASSVRMPQQQAMGSHMQQQFIGQQQPRMVTVSGHHPQQQQLLIRGGNMQQQQLVRLHAPGQQQSPQQMHQVPVGSPRMPGHGQVQVIATSTSSGLMMQNQYAGQGSYSRPIVIQQSQMQQPGAILGSQPPPQPGLVQYQYKQQPQSMSQMQQQSQPGLQKQLAPSPSSVSTSAPSTPGPQFAAPNAPGLSSSPSSASLLNAAGATANLADGAAMFSAPQSDSSQVLTKQRLDDLVREVDPYEQLDEDVKDALLQIADEFIESVVSGACQIAKHRKGTAVDVKDVQLCLERNWNMWIPGFGTDEIRPYKKACVTDAHKQRMGLIKKTLKKI